MKTCYTNKAFGHFMNTLRKTILILTLLTPLVLYATSEMNAEPDEEVGVIQNVEVLPNVDNDEVFNRDYSITDLKLYAEIIVTEKWDASEVSAFKQIIHKESSWRHNKEHYADGKSSATGLAGFLNMTWSGVGCTKTYDQYIQLECAIKYVSNRYGTPTKALAFHNRNNYY